MKIAEKCKRRIGKLNHNHPRRCQGQIRRPSHPAEQSPDSRPSIQSRLNIGGQKCVPLLQHAQPATLSATPPPQTMANHSSIWNTLPRLRRRSPGPQPSPATTTAAGDHQRHLAPDMRMWQMYESRYRLFNGGKFINLGHTRRPRGRGVWGAGEVWEGLKGDTCDSLRLSGLLLPAHPPPRRWQSRSGFQMPPKDRPWAIRAEVYPWPWSSPSASESITVFVKVVGTFQVPSAMGLTAHGVCLPLLPVIEAPVPSGNSRSVPGQSQLLALGLAAEVFQILRIILHAVRTVRRL